MTSVVCIPEPVCIVLRSGFDQNRTDRMNQINILRAPEANFVPPSPPQFVTFGENSTAAAAVAKFWSKGLFLTANSQVSPA